MTHPDFSTLRFRDPEIAVRPATHDRLAVTLRWGDKSGQTRLNITAGLVRKCFPNITAATAPKVGYMLGLPPHQRFIRVFFSNKEGWLRPRIQQRKGHSEASISYTITVPIIECDRFIHPESGNEALTFHLNGNDSDPTIYIELPESWAPKATPRNLRP